MGLEACRGRLESFTHSPVTLGARIVPHHTRISRLRGSSGRSERRAEHTPYIIYTSLFFFCSSKGIPKCSGHKWTIRHKLFRFITYIYIYIYIYILVCHRSDGPRCQEESISTLLVYYAKRVQPSAMQEGSWAPPAALITLDWCCSSFRTVCK